MVDFEHFEGFGGGRVVDNAVAVDVGVVADTFEEAVGDAGRETGAAAEEFGGFGADFSVEDFGGTVDDLGDFGFLVEFETVDVAEAIAERGGERAGASGSADDGEAGEVEADGTCGGTFADNDVEFVIFHGGVEDFFDLAVEAVDFVDKEDVAVGEVGEYGC